jgi:MFS family permease
VACLNSAAIAMLIGLYSGMVPRIQYVIADFHHFAILGNVYLYCGLAISTLVSWPLPLLHGRKLYTVAGFALALCLQIPQGIAVTKYRTPDDLVWRTLLILSRALTGFVLGFTNVNVLATLLDLFGASLQSRHPHGETPDPYDVRRHGGGMGMWLAAWSWCSTGAIGLGFAIGAFIVDDASVDWGFWITLVALLVVLLLNLITPETRRAAFRRTMAEFVCDTGSFSRVTRGEVKMHLDETGPFWWAEEIESGLRLCWRMLLQPGFLVLATYAAWVYAEFTLILMVSGSQQSEMRLTVSSFSGHCALGTITSNPSGWDSVLYHWQ